jgi:hypothetical protein
MANLLASGQVKVGDVLCIDWDGLTGRLVFEMEMEEEAATPLATPWQQPTHMQVACAA